ncbi:MAG: MoaD/ThiS family protein [Chthoniobacterales bacterium]
MKTRVEFYAVLRDEISKTPEVSVDIEAGQTIADLMAKLFEQFPALKAWDNKILIAANMDYVERDHILREEEVISIMPPVQGG